MVNPLSVGLFWGLLTIILSINIYSATFNPKICAFMGGEPAALREHMATSEAMQRGVYDSSKKHTKASRMGNIIQKIMEKKELTEEDLEQARPDR